jgi:hypothetical protein
MLPVLRDYEETPHATSTGSQQHPNALAVKISLLQRISVITEIDPSNAAILMKLGERRLSYGLIQRAYDSFDAAGREYSIQGDNEQALSAYSKRRRCCGRTRDTRADVPSFAIPNRLITKLSY